MAGRIVVGIDQSEHSVAALRWAVDEARLRDAVLEAVHVWTFVPAPSPVDTGLVPTAWAEPTEVLEASERAAVQAAGELVTQALGTTHGVEITVLQGDPSDVLLGRADAADLLVVGNRGRGSLAQALLGSTSARVADRAPCPVVIVRAPESA